MHYLLGIKRNSFQMIIQGAKKFELLGSPNE